MACEMQVLPSPALVARLFRETYEFPAPFASPEGACRVECRRVGDPSPEGATPPGRGRCAALTWPRRAVAAPPDASDRSRDALDDAQPAVCQRGGEVCGFRLEVGDEGVQSDRAGRQREQRLHHRGRLVGEVVPLLDLEA